MSSLDQARETKLGAIAAVSAYMLWGVFPLYFKLVDTVNVDVIIAHRVVWSAVSVALFLVAVKRIREIIPVFSSKRSMGWLVASTVLITVNWSVFVFGVNSGQVLSVSFGYFINPLVNVFLGMLLLGEKQNRLQALAIAIAVIAVGIQAFGMGGLPWVSLVLAFSFAGYGYCRKTVEVGAAPGLLIETLMLVPFAIAYLFWVGPTMPVPVEESTISLWLLLMLCGPVTAIPLILFSIGARRLRLTTIGIFQYISPSIQFVMAVVLFGEELNQARLISFVLIWLSLAVFTYNSIKTQSDAKKVAAQ